MTLMCYNLSLFKAGLYIITANMGCADCALKMMTVGVMDSITSFGEGQSSHE